MKKGKSNRSLLKDGDQEADYGAISEEEVELSSVVTGEKDPRFKLKSADIQVSKERTSNRNRMTIAWKNIDVFAKLKKPWYSRACCESGISIKVQVLRNVSGMVHAGTLLGILGTSGSGKSRLLDVLSARNTDGLEMKGLVTVNGRTIGKQIHAMSTRADEENTAIGMLTVREYLLFYAQLSMDSSESDATRKRRVDAILRELGLDRFADYQMRNNGYSYHYRLSDGEKSRVSFACKVLQDKEIMFCDDLISGMDTFTALTIVKVLKKLAARGKTIICTFKQLPSGVYDLIDRVIYLAEGRVAYFGDRNGALDFFESVGIKVPANYNPADYFIHSLSTIAAKNQRVGEICDKYECTPFHKKLQKRILSEVKTSDVKESKDQSVKSTVICRAPCPVQMRALLWRLWLSTIRDPKGIRLILILTLVMGVLMGVIYFQQRYNQVAIVNINGAILFMILQTSSTPLFIASIKYSFLLPHIMQDIRNGVYQLFPVFLIVFVFELVVCSLAVTIYGSIVYWMAGLYADAGAFFTCIGALLLAAHASLSIGHVIIAATPGPASAVAIATAIVPPAMLFTGLFVHLSSIPVFLSWIPYLSWFRYAFGIIIINQWHHIATLDCPGKQAQESGYKCIKTGTGVITFMDFEDVSVLVGVLIELSIIVLFRLTSLLILFIRSKRKW